MFPDRLDGMGLSMDFGIVPWDSAACGYPVAQIGHITMRDAARAADDFLAFEHWREQHAVALISCRLAHDALRESMFLEERGFRFIEMVAQPQAELARLPDFPDQGLEILPAAEADLPAIEDMAASAFLTDRFHMDHRLEPALGGERYRRWVRNTLDHPTQRLLKVMERGQVVSFFVIETFGDGRTYWHLNAIAPQCQGQGYGSRAWKAMIGRHRRDGVQRIATTIALRNTPVVNLYAGLGFRFASPQMTFHWVQG